MLHGKKTLQALLGSFDILFLEKIKIMNREYSIDVSSTYKRKQFLFLFPFSTHCG